MQPALLIRLRPAGPWRYGPGDGAPDRTDTLFRSDRLYSALTLAMQRLGSLDDWLGATAAASRPAVAFSSLFPFQGDTLFAVPPAHLWPPPTSQITAPNPVFVAKIRWRAARFVPLNVIDTLVTGGTILADQWLPDSETGCLLRRDRPNASPFRIVVRNTAAVDRLSGVSPEAAGTGCVEFEPGAGLWTLVRYADEECEKTWEGRVRSAFRLLADTGLGGRRSSGWGHAEAPEFERGALPRLLLPKLQRQTGKPDAAEPPLEAGNRYWLLSLYSPAGSDAVDWRSGSYDFTIRSGRVENQDGLHPLKKSLRMVTEGSVLVAPTEPTGAAVDVAPDNFAHPVYRSGLALAVELPVIHTPVIDTEVRIREAQAAEEPTGEEALAPEETPTGQAPLTDQPPTEAARENQTETGPDSGPAAQAIESAPESQGDPHVRIREAQVAEEPTGEEALAPEEPTTGQAPLTEEPPTEAAREEQTETGPDSEPAAQATESAPGSNGDPHVRIREAQVAEEPTGEEALAPEEPTTGQAPLTEEPPTEAAREEQTETAPDSEPAAQATESALESQGEPHKGSKPTPEEPDDAL